MSLSSWDEEEELQEKDTEILEWSKKYLSEAYINAPKSFLEAFCQNYEVEKKRIFNLDLTNFKNNLYILTDNFYDLLKLDWENIAFDLLTTKNIKIFDFIYFLNLKSILPLNLSENVFFQKYQELLEDAKYLKELSQNPEFNNRLHIKSNSSLEWEKVTEKSSYILKTEVSTYIRSQDKNSFNVIDVSENVIVLNGFEYKSALDFDEIVFLEV